MDYVKRTISTVSTFYREMNPATLSGAIDVLVIRNEAGDLVCSPFHVRFGKLKVLRTADIRVDVRVNGEIVDLSMKVGEAGEGFFVVETNRPVPLEIATSPIQIPNEGRADISPLSLDAASPDSGKLDSSQSHDVFAHDQLSSPPSGHLTSQSQPLPTRTTSFSSAASDLPRFSSATEDLVLPDQPISASSSADALSMSPPAGEWTWQWGGLPMKEQQQPLPPADSDEFSTSSPSFAPGPISMDAAGDPDLPLLPLGLAHCPDWSHKYHIALSLCYSDLRPAQDAATAEALFEANRISFEDLCSMPGILAHPNLAVRIDGHFFRWSVAAPLIASLVVFGQPITRDAFKALLDGKAQGAPGQQAIPATPTSAAPGGGSRWFSGLWGGKKDANSGTATPTGGSKKDLETGNLRREMSITDALTSKSESLTRPTSVPVPIASASATTLPASASQSPKEDHFALAMSPSSAALLATSPPKSSTARPPAIHYAKSVRLTSEQLKALPLRDGANTIEFFVGGNTNGEPACRCTLYLWNHDVKVVISDIDGTITKSDVMGHLFTAVGKDWTHSGVANLYSNIAKNGYRIIYVTSRAIGQSSYTKEFLKWVEQSGGWRLPDGPCICAPDRLLAAFTREVIQKRPQEFKIAVLRDIANLFPSQAPFYAGFGNRSTDAESYRAVRVPVQRIFTINPKGDIKLELAETYKSTYIALNDIVDQMFPPLTGKTRDLDETFNDFNYWRSPLPEVHLDIVEDEEQDNELLDEEFEQTGGYPFYSLA